MTTKEAQALAEQGQRLRQDGKLAEAEHVLKRSLGILEARRGREGCTGMTMALSELSSCLGGREEEMERIAKRCLTIQEADLGPESVQVAETLLVIGGCLSHPHQAEEGERVARRCVEIQEVHYGRTSAMLVPALNLLGSALSRRCGKLEEAEGILRRSLTMVDETNRAVDPSKLNEMQYRFLQGKVGTTVYTLGACQLRAGKLEEAEGTLRRGLATHETVLGQEKVVAVSMGDEAESMMRRSLANQEVHVGRDHKDVAYALHLLGVFLRQRGKLEEADGLLRRCMAIYETKTGTEHLGMMTSTRLELDLCLRLEGELKGWGRNEVPVGSSSSTLRMLDNSDWQYENLCDMFHTRWLKPQPARGVSVVRIFSIQYKRNVVVNLRQRFHGTSCNAGCNFMIDPQGATAPCGLSSCSVCNICMLGFNLGKNVARTARATRFPLRYGPGVYLSSVSGKANDYAGRSAKTGSDGTELRCMFVANVAVGKAFNTKSSNLPQSACPPLGYQSVVGEVGQALNFDEVVVYKEAAVLPTHLIVYALRH
ncbi:conserved unknown protein [Ectocarpus siliculosus]|uniref:PARP catalytic domain-containing protein n=1 Tax=Ectocarpus siliculosus TaxID=2880 RepID=D8LKU9_ECTSI|nr:conserved unknown protein [Ectocarpus siliculosus]|eukprot:CBN80082.1 conserved unknown protein [Ectocarpus siliculosus]